MEFKYEGTSLVYSSKTLLNEVVALGWSNDRETEISRKATGYLLSLQAVVSAIVSVECDRDTMYTKQQMLRVRTSVEAELRRRWSPTLLSYTR